jgi:hypothetical protein
MKKIFLILILTLCFQPWAKADDIKDFEIEGMSIGDSALDFFSKNEIKKNMMWHYNDNKTNDEFVIVEFYDYKSAKQYDGIQFAVKPNDKEYKIYVIAGAIQYENSRIEDCYSEMEKIDLDLSNVFSSSNRQKGDQKLKPDKTGKSKVTSVFYYFEDGGNASVQCYFYSKNYGNPNSKNNLRVGIRSSEYRDWYFSSSK